MAQTKTSDGIQDYRTTNFDNDRMSAWKYSEETKENRLIMQEHSDTSWSNVGLNDQLAKNYLRWIIDARSPFAELMSSEGW